MRNFVCLCCLIIISSLFLSGCSALTDQTDSSSSSSQAKTVTASETKSWIYSASSPVCTVDPSVLTLKISESSSGILKGKTIYLAKVNDSASTISASDTRLVTSSTIGTVKTAAGSIAEQLSADCTASGISGTDSSDDNAAAAEFVPPQTFGNTERYAGTVSRAVSESSEITVTQITPVVGTAKKTIWVDTNSSITAFTQKTATLRAVGSTCYVWVVDEYYTDGTASGNKVNAEIASGCAEKFDSLYPAVRSMFGTESDSIYYSNSGSLWNTADMSSLSDTGTKVNIVLHDIGGGDSGKGSILGYFYSKDYYPDAEHYAATSGYSYKASDARNWSNEGKYIYLDSYYAVTRLPMVYSTLAHEFQHVIGWNVKNMQQSLKPSVWYNEMLSMLCEDMMQAALGVADSLSPKCRLPSFNKNYLYSGLEYNNSSTSSVLISYASAYAFGAWCARQFGGARLVQEMAKNAYVDTASITAAVNTINGTSYTMTDLLGMYVQACIFNSETLAASYQYPTFKQNQVLSGSGYTYPLASIDLWSGSFAWLDSSAVEYGPRLLDNSAYDLHPYGFTLHKLGTVSENAATFTFSSTGADSETMYILVQ